MDFVFEENLLGHKFQVYLEKPDFDLAHIEQTHSKDCFEVAENGLYTEKGDGLYTFKSDLVLATKTADCLPIAIIGKKGKALVHAGWRGVHQEIVLNEELKKIDPILFYIGPHIQKDSFEVSEDFRDNFPNSPHFIHKDGILYFDLLSEVKDQIKKVYPSAEIKNSSECTVKNGNFHSFRRNKTKLRNWNILS